MATVKKANVAPTHPTVWIGLALATVGLLLAVFAYTGTRVYDITFAFIALAGAFVALLGILTAAWGRSIMAARASRSRRAAFSQDAMTLAKPAPVEEEKGSQDAPTIAAPREKKRLGFGARRKEEKPASGAVFAFKRRAPEPARDDPRDPEIAALLAPDPAPVAVRVEEAPVRLTLKCPQCAAQFSAEGVRPFTATCDSCGFAATV